VGFLAEDGNISVPKEPCPWIVSPPTRCLGFRIGKPSNHPDESASQLIESAEAVTIASGARQTGPIFLVEMNVLSLGKRSRAALQSCDSHISRKSKRHDRSAHTPPIQASSKHFRALLTRCNDVSATCFQRNICGNGNRNRPLLGNTAVKSTCEHRGVAWT
jgi:hypothetical protein